MDSICDLNIFRLLFACMLWLVGVTFIFDGTPQIIVQFCQIAAPRCQTTSALWLIMRSSNTGRKTSSVASAVWHVAPFCWSQMFPTSSSSIFVNKKWPYYAFGPKSAPNSDSFRVRRLFNVCVRVFCAPNATILLVYILAKIKKNFIWKDDFFLLKSTSSVSRS